MPLRANECSHCDGKVRVEARSSVPAAAAQLESPCPQSRQAGLPPLGLGAGHAPGIAIALAACIKGLAREDLARLYVRYSLDGGLFLSSDRGTRDDFVWTTQALASELDMAQPPAATLPQRLAFWDSAMAYCAKVNAGLTAADEARKGLGALTAAEMLTALGRLKPLKGLPAIVLDLEVQRLPGPVHSHAASLVLARTSAAVDLCDHFAAGVHCLAGGGPVAAPVRSVREMDACIARMLFRRVAAPAEVVGLLRALREKPSLSGPAMDRAQWLVANFSEYVEQIDAVAAGMLLSLPVAHLERWMLTRQQVVWLGEQALVLIGMSGESDPQAMQEMQAIQQTADVDRFSNLFGRLALRDLGTARGQIVGRWLTASLPVLLANAERLERLVELEATCGFDFSGEPLEDLLDWFVPVRPGLGVEGLPPDTAPRALTCGDVEAAGPARNEDMPAGDEPVREASKAGAGRATDVPAAAEPDASYSPQAWRLKWDEYKRNKLRRAEAAGAAEPAAAAGEAKCAPEDASSKTKKLPGHRQRPSGYNHHTGDKSLPNGVRKARWEALLRRDGKYTKELARQVREGKHPARVAAREVD
ncbi:MAG TPA: hypothetical protein VHA82_04655 [Ramlibacter sp.]|uniref:hypothetical protein n=1 Tax=Ramlibacter sp. TaxID=1917967 RepID=UPI002B85B3A6|nr:hypothetical protein [Ramlibacter sp.]HVZ43080.1 hypothetical protein [Ramlibacter sp.]